MGELVGLPDWLAGTLFVLIGLAIWLVIGLIGHRRMQKRTARKRPNPTRDEFISMMSVDVSDAVAEFLWNTVLLYIEPRLTPHPADHLLDDLAIDDGDWSMDWPRDFAKLRGFPESNLLDWPEGWPVTIRNYGKWLTLGENAAHQRR